jgi:hypothetical protein
MDHGITDKAGVNLAEALTVNKTLRWVGIPRTIVDVRTRANLGARAYEAFSAMLRLKTSLTLELPPLDTACGDQRILESHSHMRIEQGLIEAGRGRLLSSTQTTKAAWVDAVRNLNVTNIGIGDTPAFQVSCLYSLLRLKPSAWIL